MNYNEEIVKGLEKIEQKFNDYEINQRELADRLLGIEQKGSAFSEEIKQSLGGNGNVRKLQTQDGRELPYLQKGQSYAEFLGKQNKGFEARQAFDLGTFCRDAMLGSRDTKAASGPAVVPTVLSSSVIDHVRAKSAVAEAGAGTIMITGPTNLAQLTGDPTVYQHTEAAVDIVESDIIVAPVTLNPKLLAVLVPLTVELVSDSPNLDAILQAALTSAFAAKIDALSIATMLANASIPKSAIAHDPAVWAKVLDAIAAALALNQDLPFAHISTPANFMARAAQLASTAGSWLGKPPALANMLELFTSTMTADQALFGDFASGFAIAVRDELRVEVVRHAKPTSASHLLVAHLRADGVVLQPGRLFWQKKVP